MMNAIQAEARPTATSAISTPETSSLSAVVSRKVPRAVVCFQRRASRPSKKSVTRGEREQQRPRRGAPSWGRYRRSTKRHHHRRERDPQVGDGREEGRGAVVGGRHRHVARIVAAGLTVDAPGRSTRAARGPRAAVAQRERALGERARASPGSVARTACFTAGDRRGAHRELADAEAEEERARRPRRPRARRRRRPSGRAPRRLRPSRGSGASTAGCSASVSAATCSFPRSAASVYCVRSFVPIEKKSTSAASAPAVSAAAGTSTMMPTSSGASDAERRARPVEQRARAARSSSSVVDHREHHAHGVVGGDAQDRAELRLEELRPREPEPHAPHPEERVRLVRAAPGRGAACRRRRRACGSAAAGRRAPRRPRGTRPPARPRRASGRAP